MTLLRTVVRTEGVTAVVATHDPAMLDVADRVVELRDGQMTGVTTPDGDGAGRASRRPGA